MQVFTWLTLEQRRPRKPRESGGKVLGLIDLPVSVLFHLVPKLVSYRMHAESLGEAFGDGEPQPYRPALADAWALGIVFIEMTSIVLPWRKPTLSDPGFSLYMECGACYLQEVTPITDVAAELLYRMLHPRPEMRPSLRRVSKTIKQLGDIFETDKTCAKCPGTLYAD